VRVRLNPVGAEPILGGKLDWAADFRRHLAKGPLHFDIQLQFYTDPKTTPIEDASQDWPEAEAPYVTVAKLTIPPQDTEGPTAQEFMKAVEASKFDPWWALAEHRPLGEIMRSRKVAYRLSQEFRGAV